MSRRREAEMRRQEEERPRDHRVGGVRPQAAHLHRPTADAVVAAIGALVRGVISLVPGSRCGVMLRTMTDLVRPADERAGKEKAGQERDKETSHRDIIQERRARPFLKHSAPSRPVKPAARRETDNTNHTRWTVRHFLPASVLYALAGAPYCASAEKRAEVLTSSTRRGIIDLIETESQSQSC